MLCTMPGWRSCRYSFHTVTRRGVLMDAAPGPYSRYFPTVGQISSDAGAGSRSARDRRRGSRAPIVLAHGGMAVGEVRRAQADRADLLALTGARVFLTIGRGAVY